AAMHTEPSFAGSDAVLYVRSENGKSEIWRMARDGTAPKALGVAECYSPSANPSGTAFLCLGGPRRNVLFVYPLAGGSGRKLHELTGVDRFIYIRWSGSGDRIFATSSDRRFLTLNSSTGAILRSDPIEIPDGASYESLLAAACNMDASVQAFSFSHISS